MEVKKKIDSSWPTHKSTMKKEGRKGENVQCSNRKRNSSIISFFRRNKRLKAKTWPQNCIACIFFWSFVGGNSMHFCFYLKYATVQIWPAILVEAPRWFLKAFQPGLHPLKPNYCFTADLNTQTRPSLPTRLLA